MTNTTDLDPRRPEVAELDREMERCSRSYASACRAKDNEGIALVSARYLDLAAQSRAVEADYLQAETTQPRPRAKAWGLRRCQHDDPLRPRSDA